MKLHPYQETAVRWILDHEHAGLFLEPGLGKTITTIVALDHLRLLGDVGRVLLVAPKRVALETWPDELSKWSALHNLTHAVAVGTPKQRASALAAGADVTITNVDNLVWLLDQHKALPYDTLVVDELSLFKSSKAERFRALRRHLTSFRRVITLTGTPAPNGLIDLWPQLYVTDQGASLGTRVGVFQSRYFNPGMTRGHQVFSWHLKPGADEQIYDAIGATVLSMRAKDHLDLPARTDNVVTLTLPPAVAEGYSAFVRDQVQALADGATITAANAAVLSNKLQQYASGSIYDEDGGVSVIHDVKLDAVRDIVEGVGGSPVLVFYTFTHELHRLQAAFPEAETYREGTLERWNRGEVPMLLLHPKAAGHGLNLQHGGHTIVWFGPGPWSLELWQQANARLDRQGQTHPVIVHRLVAAGTVDEKITARLGDKEAVQDSLLDAMRQIVADNHNI